MGTDKNVHSQLSFNAILFADELTVMADDFMPIIQK